jgi:hypothetical protein
MKLKLIKVKVIIIKEWNKGVGRVREKSRKSMGN